MKHKILFLLTFALFTSTIFAGPIDVDLARGKAIKFLQKYHPDARLEEDTPAYAPVQKRLLKGGKTVESPAYYVFNAEDDLGFVIISSDDRTDEVLGYSTNCRFDAA
jgi:hypothetical protein